MIKTGYKIMVYDKQANELVGLFTKDLRMPNSVGYKLSYEDIYLGTDEYHVLSTYSYTKHNISKRKENNHALVTFQYDTRDINKNIEHSFPDKEIAVSEATVKSITIYY